MNGSRSDNNIGCYCWFDIWHSNKWLIPFELFVCVIKDPSEFGEKPDSNPRWCQQIQLTRKQPLCQCLVYSESRNSMSLWGSNQWGKRPLLYTTLHTGRQSCYPRGSFCLLRIAKIIPFCFLPSAGTLCGQQMGLLYHLVNLFLTYYCKPGTGRPWHPYGITAKCITSNGINTIHPFIHL